MPDPVLPFQAATTRRTRLMVAIEIYARAREDEALAYYTGSLERIDQAATDFTKAMFALSAIIDEVPE